MKQKYIILEIIPTKIKGGDIVQLSALKIDKFKIKDRFDYRLNKEKVNNIDLLNMTSYDNDRFNYENSTRSIKIKFKKWIEDYDLLFIDNLYTKNYIKYIKNKKESIFKYLDINFSDDVIIEIIKKYKLKESNDIVDILFEALKKKNNKG